MKRFRLVRVPLFLALLACPEDCERREPGPRGKPCRWDCLKHIGGNRRWPRALHPGRGCPGREHPSRLSPKARAQMADIRADLARAKEPARG